MWFIGDIHSKADHYKGILEMIDRLNPLEQSIQVGDLGIWPEEDKFPRVDQRHKFIRGNHDYPEGCRLHPNYLGEYGITELGDAKLFYMGGAYSIDQKQRTPGIDWWRDEELSYLQIYDAIELFIREKPNIVVTHDAPAWAVIDMFSRIYHIDLDGAKSATRTGLDIMFDNHKPDLWVFGHYHITRRTNIYGTVFQCVGAGDTHHIPY